MKKYNLPSKICIVCNLPFIWRKKWGKNWANVKYCSNKCSKKKIIDNIVIVLFSDMKKLSSKSSHKKILKSNRLKNLEEKMKINMKKRKEIKKNQKNG